MSEKILGACKWFNDQQGYGFVKSLEDEKDYFVHITDLTPTFNTVKPCLYTGEYVEFDVAPNGANQDGTERKKAINVTGVKGGPLLCDHGDITYRSYSKIGFSKNEEGGLSKNEGGGEEEQSSE